MKKILSLIVVLMLAFGVKAQTTAPDFDCYDEFGRNIHLYDVLDNGQYAFLYFFITDTDDPEGQFSQIVAETYYNYGANQDDVYFIGIDPIGDTLTAKRWSLDYQTDFPIIHKFTEGSNVYDICESYGVRFLATLKLVAPDHSIIIDDIWPVKSTQHLISEIDAAIAKHKGNNGEEGEDPEEPGEGDSTITNCKMRLASIASIDGNEIWDYIYSAPDNTHLVCINEMDFATPATPWEFVDSLEYDERGNITKLSTWYKTEGGWISTGYIEYEYNDKNQKTSRTNYNNFGNVFELGAIHRYSYDEEGKMTEWALEFGGNEEYYQKATIEYNEEGYKKAEIVQQFNKGTYYLENYYMTEYEYDANNNVTRIAVSDWYAGVWTLQSATINEYDEYGNCIVSEQTTASGTVQARKVYTYDTSVSAENIFYYPNPENDYPQLPESKKHLLKSFEYWAQNDDMQLSYVTTYVMDYEVVEGSETPGGDEPNDPENPGGDEPNDPENPGGDEPNDPENPGGDEPNDPENPGGDEPDDPENPGGDEPDDPENPGDNPEQPAETYSVIAVANPENAGTVEGAGVYAENMNVTLVATAKSGYKFVNWTENGVIVSTEAEYSFVITNNRNLTANFVSTNCKLTVVINPEEAGNVEGAGTYKKDTEVKLIATANPGYKFVNWTENDAIVSTNPEYSFVITDNTDLVANFVSTENISELTSSFSIYPNPVNDKLYIEILTQTQTLTVEIYDVYGRQQSTVNGQQSTVIDVTNLNSGVYFVMIKTNEGVVKKRFVKN